MSAEPTALGGRCLVTGASGFIGGRVVARLHAEGIPVRGLVRPTSDRSELDALGVELAVADLQRAPELGDALDGCDRVVHCAALVSDWATVAEIRAANVRGTQNLLFAAGAATRPLERFVHLSSTDVYGHPGTARADEQHPFAGFANWYAQSKRDAEAAVRTAQRTQGVACVILRPATVYGPGSSDVIGEIARAIRARHMLLIDRGRAIAGLCFVENVVDAVLLALGHPAAPGAAFNVSDELEVTWRRLVDDLAAGLGAPPPRLSISYPLANAIGVSLEHGYRALRRATGIRTAPLLSRQAVQVLGRDQDFSSARARELLGWLPRVGYEAGLQQTLDWLLEPN